MTPEQTEKLREITRLLREAYADYFARTDSHCKSSEGAIEVYYPGIFEDGDPTSAKGIGVYSYVLGPSRMHHWWLGDGNSDYADKHTGDRDPFDVALEDVKKWHADQMAWQPDE